MDSQQFSFDFPAPGPDNLKLWLGSGMEFIDVLEGTRETLDYYRRLYANNFGIVHSLRQIYLVVALGSNKSKSKPCISYSSYVLFFKSKKELELYESMFIS